jgi:glycosyltransferase involved in cell wall biosynthesis
LSSENKNNNSVYLCDLVIPAYREKDYILKTLEHITKQTLYTQGLLNVIIGEYKDGIDKDNDYLEKLCSEKDHFTYINIDQKGIPYARNMSIIKGLKSNIICNFDADSIFNRFDALEFMIRPILNKEAVITNCECILFDFKNNHAINRGPSTDIYSFLSNIGNELEKHLFFSRGPGLTVSKEAFINVGGFRQELSVGEDYALAWDVCLQYGLVNKRFISEVKVLTSDRRAQASKDLGLGVFDYSKHSFR